METPELPECPVCLQPFDGYSTTPRILPCGHSVCEVCLVELPKPTLPRTIRCPACTQLVNYPGPSALPKNIDLLRFSSSLTISNPNHLKPIPKKPIKSFQDFIPNLWSHEFYSDWKEWIISEDMISVEASGGLDGYCLYGRITDLKKALLGPPTKCLLKGNQKVTLFKVGSFMHNHDSRFKYSYVTKVMWVLFEMTDGELDKLGLILRSCLKEYRICTSYGLWYNQEDKGLYLVCERNNTSLLDVISSRNEDDISGVAMVCIDLCETISRLREVELVFGCLSLSCFAVDEFGHVFINVSEVLTVGLRVQKILTDIVSLRQMHDSKEPIMNLINDILEIHALLSPELLFEFLRKEGIDLEFSSSTYAVSYSSDVWSLACILHWLFVGKSFGEETNNYLSSFILSSFDGNGSDCEGLYIAWLEKVSSLLDARLGSEFVVMKELLKKCLHFNPNHRPHVTDLWICMRELIIKPKFDILGSLEQKITNESTGHCLLLGNFSKSLNKNNKVEDESGSMGDYKVEELVAESAIIKGLSKNSLKCIDLKHHLDCISGLAVGGGFLFSSSFDKTVNVWSIQDLSHVHTFKGHEHRITSVVFVNKEEPLCISGDNGGYIFIWGITDPFEEKPIKRLSEEKDWRYSGIHALAVSGTQYFYTGSGDKSIKAWSMHDYTVSCTMSGHKSVVSTLAVCNGVLYSGSWDGTIRLWCLSDHSPLGVLGEETPICGSVLSLAAHGQTLVAAHENGCTKIWNNDVPLTSTSAHTGSIFSICMEGKWLFSGGWDKTVIVQELSGDESLTDTTQIGTISGDSVITALLYWEGKLFVGQADRIIKVYYCGG